MPELATAPTATFCRVFRRKLALPELARIASIDSEWKRSSSLLTARFPYEEHVIGSREAKETARSSTAYCSEFSLALMYVNVLQMHINELINLFLKVSM